MRLITEKGNLRGRTTAWKDDSGSTLWKYEDENVYKESSAGVEKDRRTSFSCKQLLISLSWRDRGRNEGEAKKEDARKAGLVDGNRQRDKAKWPWNHGGVFVQLRHIRGKTIAETSHGVGKAQQWSTTQRFFNYGGGCWLSGKMQ